MNQITYLRDDPYITASGDPVREAYVSIKVVSTLQNSVDGSGEWSGVHLLDANGNFMQGGWIRGIELPALTPTPH